MDTDSAYIAISGQSIKELVKPHLKEQFYQEWNQWLPAKACGEHQEALCSKTYFGWGDKNKCSTKGISKTQNAIDKEQFLQVLKTKQSLAEDKAKFRWNECRISSEGQCSVHIPPTT